MLLVNFKNYTNTWGEGAVKLAKICHEVGQETGVPVIPLPAALDAGRVMAETRGPVWLQNADRALEGAHTGWVSLLHAQHIGVGGTLINHAEHKQAPGKIKAMLAGWNKAKQQTSKPVRIGVCFRSFGQLEKWVGKLPADYFIYEPPALIGSSDQSVASMEPKIIQKMATFLGKRPLLVGAGIKSAKDVQIALQMGAKGVLVTSAVVISAKPGELLREMVTVFLNKS